MTPITRILYDGRVHTHDPAAPLAQAVALAGDRIAAVGDSSTIRALAGPGTRAESLGGRALYPGFTDAHLHWQGTAEAFEQVDLFDVPSKAEALERVRAFAAARPPGTWISGYGWSHDLWPDRAFPAAADLDAVAPAHPVYLKARSGHAGWVNTAALRAAALGAHTPDPDGGQIVRGPDGQPTGILFEWPAMSLVTAHIPRLTGEALADAMLRTQERALADGMTGFHDFDTAECFHALGVLEARGLLRQRVVKYCYPDMLAGMKALGLYGPVGSDRLRIGGLKIFADGALGVHTAWMLEPYLGEPDNTGLSTYDPDALYDAIRAASLDLGLPSAIHAIGDQAVRVVLDVFARVRADEARAGIPRAARRHRIEHVQCIHPDDVGRLAELGLAASMQPIHATSDYANADAAWGPARVALSYNPRVQLDRGVVVAFGSDSPYDRLGIMAGVAAAVTRHTPDGRPGSEGWNPAARVSLAEALAAYTTGPAWACGMERVLGRIAPGALADAVVFERPLADVPREAVHAQRPIATLFAGEWAYGGV
jgi:hypothetical protein